jgi:tRNA threonylcarbamoyladenosine biosynthesis protein TsaB
VRILALDTCLTACSVAVCDGDRVLAHAFEVMARGHQERLAPMAERVMAEAGIAFADLERIGVTLGPGSFTGLRVGLAFAKGLVSALAIPAVGVGTLEALAADTHGPAMALVDARRGQVYAQAFRDGGPLGAPQIVPVEQAQAEARELNPATLIGSGGPLVASAAPNARLLAGEGADARTVARLAAARSPERLEPLYLRAPDAKLPI